MATDAQSLMTAANCYVCVGSSHEQVELMKLSLLAQILKAQNPMADTSPQALLAAANCYTCFLNSPALMGLAELALLAQIVTGGTGSGGGTLGGTGSPVGVVTPSSAFAFYIQTDSAPPGLIWEWYGGAWH